MYILYIYIYIHEKNTIKKNIHLDSPSQLLHPFLKENFFSFLLPKFIVAFLLAV